MTQFCTTALKMTSISILTLAEISADILALEQETEDLLNEITKGASP